MSRVIEKRHHKKEPKPRAQDSGRLSILRIATDMGCSRETVRKRMANAGISSESYTLKEVVIAFAGDYFNASELPPKDRLALAQAIKVERENKEADRETVRLDEVEKMLTELVTLPIRQWVLDQPQRIDTRCNPDHPEIARIALRQDGDDLLKMLREKLS